MTWYAFKTDESIAIANVYVKFAAGTEDIGEVKKDTPYLILTIGERTKWFDESGVKKLLICLHYKNKTATEAQYPIMCK